jgi:hypothetical protein
MGQPRRFLTHPAEGWYFYASIEVLGSAGGGCLRVSLEGFKLNRRVVIVGQN